MNKQKASNLVLQAEKKLSFFNILSALNSAQANEEAAELFKEAGNLYKFEKSYSEAFNCFLNAAKCLAKTSPYDNTRSFDTAEMWMNASLCSEKILGGVETNDKLLNPTLSCLQQAAKLYHNAKRDIHAGKCMQKMGEIYEGQYEYKNAITSYEQAVRYYASDELNNFRNQCLEAMARLYVMEDNFFKASEIFENLAVIAIDCSLTKNNVNDYLLNSGICFITFCMIERDAFDCIDQKLSKYNQIYSTFLDREKGRFLLQIKDAVEQNNIDIFTNLVREYDLKYKLEKWMIVTLLRIKEAIKVSVLECVF
jgi:alpha-soluble NSF attachment protein